MKPRKIALKGNLSSFPVDMISKVSFEQEEDKFPLVRYQRAGTEDLVRIGSSLGIPDCSPERFHIPSSFSPLEKDMLATNDPMISMISMELSDLTYHMSSDSFM